MEDIIRISSVPYTHGFPSQKQAFSKKNNLEFIKKCVEGAVDMTVSTNDRSLRMERDTMVANYNLIDGILDKNDVYKITNPWGIDGFDRDLVDYPLARPRINLLLGEEFSRRFDWQVRVVNADAVSEKEQMVAERLFETAAQIALNEAFDEADAKRKLAKIDRWRRYTAQDIREKLASDILHYLYTKLHMHEKFNSGFLDVLASAEEIYHVDIIGGEPDFRRVNPLNLYVVRSNESPYIEDADIIVEDSYASIGWVIDHFYDQLESDDIKKLEKGVSGNLPEMAGQVNYSEANPISILSTTLELGSSQFTRRTDSWDDAGNVRILRVTWRSMRKVGLLKYYDESGTLIKQYVDEAFKADELLGQTVEWMWINEWWEAIRLADDIYVKWGPKDVQIRSSINKSVGGSGYVGTLYNTNANRAYSLVDSLKPYQYLYDELMDRLKEALAKFHGPMIELDFAKMPDNWEPEKWMYYAQKMGYLITDSFKEGAKGAAKGALAGNFNTSNKVLNPDLGDYIQHHILMLNFIESKIGTITGINEQRLGSIDTREQVGSVERAVTQSSHITEKYFQLHNNTKLRALQVLLEYSKHAYKNDSTVLQYITGDLETMFLKLDGEKLAEAEYGVFVSNTPNDQELYSAFKQLAQAALQNDKATLSNIMDIYLTNNISEMKIKIAEAEEEAMQRMQETQQQQIKAQQEAAQMQMEQIEKDRQLKEADSIRKAQTSIAVAQINAASKSGEAAEEPVEEVVDELGEEKLKLDKDKFAFDKYLRERQQKEDERSNKVNEALKARQIRKQSANKSKK
jgi:hypothetical protein